ncbi:MAG: ATP-binding protein [Oscillospiraceae bacterium]|nr:ATP-binding protein [Oscillospiraceae bacterium]
MDNTKARGDGVMLKKFGFENSYCYRDRVELDMSAELSEEIGDDGNPLPKDITLYKDVRTQGGSRGILPVAAIYGKNASGKTKLLKTLFDVAKDALGESFAAATSFSDMSPFQQIIENRKFIIADKQKPELSYFICVVLKDAEYTLSYTIDEDGVKKEKVTQRGLQKDDDDELVYERGGDDYEPKEGFPISEYLNLLTARGEKQLWFPLIAPAQEGLNNFYEWFRYVRDGFNQYEADNQDKNFISIAKRIFNGNDEPFRLKLRYFLQCLDKSIVNIEGRKHGTGYRLWVFHRKADRKDRTLAHLLKDESDGTLALIAMFPLIYRILEMGMPLICDAFDEKLHPLVFKELIRIFKSKETNDKNAQLIFTAHDTFALDASLLRYDEVHIVDKDEFSVSAIQRLSEKGLPPYDDMEHGFRTGVYGSFPTEFPNCYKSVGESDGTA